MPETELIIAALGLAFTSGINLYAATATLGVLGLAGLVGLPAELELVTHPAVIAAAAFMYVVEFFADKTPGVDTVWDTIHSFIRIPAGAILAMATVGDVDPGVQAAALIVGGGLAGAAHGFKAGARVLINTSPEPFTNIGASVAEDATVIGGVTLAFLNPAAFLILAVILLAFMIWLTPKIWRGIMALISRIRALFGGPPPERLESRPAKISLSLKGGEPPSLPNDKGPDAPG